MSTSTSLVEGGVAAFFTFGYLGFVWTHSITWGSAIVLSVWVATVSFLFPTISRFTLFVELLAAFQLGIFLAWFIINASLMPPLVPRLAYLFSTTTIGKRKTDTDLEGGLHVETYGRQASTITGAVTIVSGIFILLNVYDGEFSFTQRLIYGIGSLVIGAALLIYGFYKLFSSEVRLDRTDGRYILFLYLFVLLPPLAYNSLVNFIRPFHIISLWVVLILLTAFIVYAEISWLGIKPGAEVVMLEGDPRFLRRERYPIRIVVRWVLVTALPLLIVYNAAWAAETFETTPDTGDVLNVVGIVVFVMVGISLFFHGASSVTRASGQYQDRAGDEDENDDELQATPAPTDTTITKPQRRAKRSKGVHIDQSNLSKRES